MMKSFFKKLAFVMALAMVVSMAAPAATTASAASDLKIAYQNGGGYGITELNIAEVGATEDLKFLGAPNWKELGVTWTSNNEAVATVDQNGLVTAVAAGTTEVACQVGADVAVVKVNVVDVATYTATMGTAEDRNITAKTIEEGDTFDFAFYGIKDYDVKRYFCTWASDDTSVATVDQKGLVEAVAPGTAKITLIVFNKVTGQVHNVDACTVTVPGKATPTPVVVVEPSIEVKQITARTFELTFKDVDVDLKALEASKNKNQIEVYEKQVDAETGVEHLYAWQISDINIVKEKENTVLVTGYLTNELLDATDYVVKYVVPNADEDLVKTIAETEFEASVGDVVKLDTYYWSYVNNQGKYTFENVAYTTAGTGEDIPVKVFYNLYDDQGIDVTEHYLVANDYEDLISLELVTEDAENYFDLDEDTNILVYNDIPETSYVEFTAVYDDYVDAPVEDTVKMVVKMAPDYKISSIDKWGINITEKALAANVYWKLKQWVALYDDYDVDNMDPLQNHEIVLWFTDNYGNRFVTDEAFIYTVEYEKINGGKYWYYLGDDSACERFMSEGYEIYFESKNPQVLVVGDEYDDATTSNVITTKKTGTATINVSLQNASEGTLTRVDTLKIAVKAARYVKNVNVAAGNVKVTTDSIPVVTKYNPSAWNAVAGFTTEVFHDFPAPTYTSTMYKDFRAGNEMSPVNMYGDIQEGATTFFEEDQPYYDPRFTGAGQEITVLDNHGELFGIYNESLRQSLTLSMEATNTDTDDLDIADIAYNPYSNAWWHPYPVSFDGVKVAEAVAGEKVNTIKFAVVATDAANEKEAKTTFRLALNKPDYVGANDESDIEVDSKLSLRAEGTYGYVNTANLIIPIQVVETSNKLDVNYADNIELVTTQARYNALFVSRTATASEGALYLAVFNPDGEIVNYLTEDTDVNTDDWGLVQNESGNYEFHYADHKDGAKGTRFAEAGSYTVKLMEVTKTTSTDKIASNGVSTTVKKFKLVDDRMEFSYEDQDYIYVDADQLDDFADWDINGDAIAEIAADAFTYVNDTWNETAAFNNKPLLKEIGGVRYNVNDKANSVVIKDVFFKVYIDINADGDWNDDEDYNDNSYRELDDQKYWYYVLVEMPDGKTVSLEDTNLLSGCESVDYRKDPDGRKIQ